MRAYQSRNSAWLDGTKEELAYWNGQVQELQKGFGQILDEYNEIEVAYWLERRVQEEEAPKEEAPKEEPFISLSHTFTFYFGK